MTASSNSRYRDPALALAGVAQFAIYAHELAADGHDRAARIEAAKQVVFSTDPDSVMDVFGDLSRLGDGIAYLKRQLEGEKPDQRTALIARYIGQILRLSGALQKDSAALGRIRGALDRARLAEASEVPVILDEAYRENISPLRPRLMLHGHPSYLQNESIQARARTHLLAAVRCGILWRQCGGGFMSLFFKRKALRAALEDLGPIGPARG